MKAKKPDVSRNVNTYLIITSFLVLSFTIVQIVVDINQTIYPMNQCVILSPMILLFLIKKVTMYFRLMF
jgi:hypothetical protein